jgi:hypothetical protein
MWTWGFANTTLSCVSDQRFFALQGELIRQIEQDHSGLISTVLTGANVHDSRVAIPLTRISAQRVDVCYELMDAAYCSTVIREEIRSAGRVLLIDHNPRKGEKREFAPHEAQRYKTRSGAERCNARLMDEFGARHVQVRGHAKVMCHLMLGVVALCADQFTSLLV